MLKAALTLALVGAVLSTAPAHAYGAVEREGVETVKFKVVVNNQQQLMLPDILAAEAEVDYANGVVRFKLTKRFCHESGCPLAEEAPVPTETSSYTLSILSQDVRKESYTCTNTIRAGLEAATALMPAPTLVLCDLRGTLSGSNRRGDTQVTVTMTHPNLGAQVVTLYGPALKPKAVAN
jgi:hypothetical protein